MPEANTAPAPVIATGTPSVLAPAADPTYTGRTINELAANKQATLARLMDEQRPLAAEPDAPVNTPANPAAAEPGRGPDGRFIAVDGNGDALDVPANDDFDDAGQRIEVAEEVAAAPAAPAGPVIPEGYVAPSVVAEADMLGAKVYNGEGVEMNAPDLVWDVPTSAGQRKLSTAQLLGYARDGVYNHDRHQQQEQTLAENRQLTNRMQQAEQFVQRAQADRERLLSDGQYLTDQILAYEAQNTPEARQQREHERLQQERQQFQLERMGVQHTQYIDQQITPAFDQILQKFPTISQEEIAAKFLLAADPYRVQGIIHPNGFEPLGQWVVNDLVPWARQVHTHRSANVATTNAATAKAAEQSTQSKLLQDAQVRNQRAKRQLSRGLAPSQRATQPAGGSPRPILTPKDAKSSALQRVAGGLG